MIKIYNSLSQMKESLQPQVPGEVSLYVCGMTVYDYCHLGHARVLVSFDMITRYLRQLGFKVTYVRNITDIDDKIIRRAEQQQVPYTQLTERFITAMHEDERALNVLPPDQEPRATEHIASIITFIEGLIAKGYAYAADNGDVYYQVRKFADYGKLSRKDLNGQQAGIRVEVEKHKRDPLDFALWKAAKPGEPSWSSPWGAGRPGWHIECSAMSMECLGTHFDLHGGGFDLQFPHHENEIAQSEALNEGCFANLWMHVGYLQINAEKMSKSEGNFLTIREILADTTPEVLRYFLLSSHYRSALNFSDDSLDNARAALTRLYISCRGLEPGEASVDDSFSQAFHAAMQDDFNTPEALAVLFKLANKINVLRNSDREQASQYVGLLRQLGAVLGILEAAPEDFFTAALDTEMRQQIELLVARREVARRNKDWATADAVRDELQQLNIEIEDTATGTVWRQR
jgi:cysteinyl-tRNA synthetase